VVSVHGCSGGPRRPMRRSDATVGAESLPEDWRMRLVHYYLRHADRDPRPSYERARSREEWRSFCDAFGGALDHTRISELCVREGWADEGRLAEIVSAFKRFGANTANCFALAWGEAVAFKPA
jgi:hypothetical protein